MYYNVSSIDCREGTVQVTRPAVDDDSSSTYYNLAYKLFRPKSLSSRKAAPIVVLHGGPSVPSDYLLPLAKVIPYRSILFYDQLGCGDSDEPDNGRVYSIDGAVDDLEIILRKLGVRRFHLYGQSFGGILAFEYLKRVAERDEENAHDEGCLSFILSSTPCSVPQVEQEADRLLANLADPTLFRETHQCRTPDMPPPLATAYAKAGTTWRGTAAISNYTATALSSHAARLPSGMLLCGEYDFVTAACIAPWKETLLSPCRSVRIKQLEGCSHHGLLENPVVYGDLVDSFFTEYD